MTIQLAVLGNPVEHSRSPEIHDLFGAQCGVELDYIKVLVPTGKFTQTADDFLQTGIGFNVTVPCKQDAYHYVDHLDEAARQGQAVNTVSRDQDGRLLGSNTDGAGLVSDMTRNLGWSLTGARILVVGAGGAVAGVLPALLSDNPAAIHIYNRTPEKAQQLVSHLGQAQVEAVEKSQLQDAYDIVINGTSASLAGHLPDLPAQVLDKNSRCYDMVYAAHTTAFNAWCEQQADCETADGLGMLVEQAALSFSIWFDRKVDTGPVLESLRNSTSENNFEESK